jgi:phasin family protein
MEGTKMVTKPKADTKQEWEMPFPDFTKIMQAYKIPGMDFSTFMDREKKNIEALTKANKIAFEGWQALVRRQSEILKETMEETMANARKQDAAQRVEVAKQGFEKAIAHMRELAEMATKSQKEAFEIVQKRIAANVHEMQRFGKPD